MTCSIARSVLRRMTTFLQDALTFHGNHDWISSPMSSKLACLLFIADLWSWSLYYIEPEVVKNSHKKYKAHKTSNLVVIHSIAGVTETVLGLVFILHRNIFLSHSEFVSVSTEEALEKEFHERISYCLAMLVCLVAVSFHIPTNLMLAPKVWGLKNMTVTGYVFVALLRLVHVFEIVFKSYQMLPQLWILLHTATMVRLVAYHVCPFSTTTGNGDLLTDPFMYTISTGLATFTTLAFVYPPVVNVAALILIGIVEYVYPTKITSTYVKNKSVIQ